MTEFPFGVKQLLGEGNLLCKNIWHVLSRIKYLDITNHNNLKYVHSLMCGGGGMLYSSNIFQSKLIFGRAF